MQQPDQQPDNDDVDRSGAAAAKPRRSWGGIALLVAVAIAAIIVVTIFAGKLAPVAGLVAVAVVLITVFWLIRAQLPSILLVFVSVLLVSVIATHRPPKLRGDRMEAEEGGKLSEKWAAAGKSNENLPIVLHLVFDEMMSPGAMTPDLPGGADMRQSMLALGQKHSFRMFDSVYSRYFFSSSSLSNLMDTEYRGRMGLADLLGEPGVVQENPYFDDMARRGYRTVVFQTSLMDFCANANVDLCESFDSFDPGGKGPVGLDARNQRASLWQTFVRAYQPSYTSEAGQALIGKIYGMGKREVGVLGTADRYDAQRFPAWFERFARFATSVPRGTHVFAHFMVPHSPYLLSEDCVISGTFEGGYYLSEYPASEQSALRQKFYQGYFAQLGCVRNKLDDFLTTVSENENFRDAVIIVHGDHGSRISSGNIIEDYTPRDFVDNYGTFFAVRSPAAPAGVDCEFTSLPEVFRRYVPGGSAKPAPSATPAPVIVLSRAAGNARVEAPMPKFGCAEGGKTPAQ